MTAAWVGLTCAGCAGAWLGKSRQHLCVCTNASVYSLELCGQVSSTPLVCWRWKEKCCGLGFGHKVVSMHCAPENPLRLVSLSSPFWDWWEANSPFFAVLLLLGSQLCLGVMLQTPGSVSACVTSPQLSDEPLGASPWARQCPLRWVAVPCRLQCCGAFHKMAVAPWLCCDKSCVSASEEPALLLGGALERRALGKDEGVW